jgi:pyridoxamine 5'-phosphate oxidase family protein
MFTEKEVAYLNSQRLARIATVSGKGQPDVAPVGYTFDGEYFYISGRNNAKTYKYKNVQKNKQIALVVDDLESVQPWRPRGIKIHGSADLVERAQGYMGTGTYIRVKPERKWSWGVEEPLRY